jgi:hypothetical protein
MKRLIDERQQRECIGLQSPTKKPRVSLAALLPQYAVPPPTPVKCITQLRASPTPEEIAKLDEDEAAAGDEVIKHETEADDWEIVYESKNQIAAMQLVADLDEAAQRLRNLSPSPLIHEQRSTRSNFNALSSVIRRVLTGTKSGRKII